MDLLLPEIWQIILDFLDLDIISQVQLKASNKYLYDRLKIKNFGMRKADFRFDLTMRDQVHWIGIRIWQMILNKSDFLSQVRLSITTKTSYKHLVINDELYDQFISKRNSEALSCYHMFMKFNTSNHPFVKY